MSPYRIRVGDRWTTAERVTEILRRGMPSPDLERWKIRQAVTWALTHPQVAVTVDQALHDWEAATSRHSRRGTRVHKVIAAILRGEDPPDPDPADEGYLVAWGKWRLDHPWEPTHVEQTMLSADGKVAGTADAVFDGSILVDWKSVSDARKLDTCYPDQRAQVGAYSIMRDLVTAQQITGRAPIITEGHIVRLCSDGSYGVTTIAGKELQAARQLWYHVKRVAEAVSRD